MKKLMVGIVVALLMATGISGQAKDISITAGISLPNFQEINDKVLIVNDPMGLLTVTRLDKMSYAYPIELTVMYDLSKNVKLGFKTGYTYVPTAEVNITSPLVLKYKYTIGMVPVLVGGKYLFQINERIKMGAGLLGGIGLGYFREYGECSAPWNFLFGGLTFCADATFDIDYEIVKNISFVSSVGYRYARFDNMPRLSSSIEAELQHTKDLLGYDHYATIKTSYGISALDFSGLTLTAGLKWVL